MYDRSRPGAPSKWAVAVAALAALIALTVFSFIPSDSLDIYLVYGRF